MTAEQLPTHQPLPVPDTLAMAGRALWLDMSGAYVLEPGEQALLLTASQVADNLAELDERVQEEGRWDYDNERINPALVEHRQQALLLAKLVGQLTPAPEKAEKEPRKYGYWNTRGRQSA